MTRFDLHELRAAVEALPRLLDKILESEDLFQGTPCWVWQGARDRYGYGKFTMGGRTWKAHRASYHLLKAALSEEDVVDHLCRRRACVNPAHHEPLTNRQNTLRGLASRKAHGTLPLPFFVAGDYQGNE